MKRLLDSNLLAGVVIAAVAFGLSVAAREAALFERADLALHDRLVRSAHPPLDDERFVIVLESESDLRRWKYPLSDEVFADLVERIVSSGAAVLAIDKLRDSPVAPGSERLAELLRKQDRVYWAKKFGSTPTDDVPAPAALDARFVGCADIVDDRDGAVRRALLYLDDGTRVCPSLAFLLARHMAAQKGVVFSIPKEDPDRYDLGKVPVRALNPGDGPYAGVDTGGFQVAVPSASLARIRTVGLTEVLEGRVPPETFRGRTVLFGSGAESLRDYFNVPSLAPDGVEKIPGVAVHAQVASYLLRVAEGRATAMQLAPRSAWLSLTALTALFVGTIACSRRRIRITLAGVLAVALVLVGVVVAMAHEGYYIGMSAPLVALSLAFVAGVVRSAWVERRERGQLMSLFGRHVSREVAEDLWQKRDEYFTHGAIKPREIIATMFFLDIRSFTTVSEKLEPARVVGWLNRGLSAVIGEVTRHRGVVTRFAGDAAMAVFGAPLSSETEAAQARDAANAIDAALAIGPVLDVLNSRFDGEGLPRIRVRIGVNTGTVTQCSVGASDRAEFTVLGDAVNTASRLESYTMDDAGETARVLIGEETFRLAGEGYETRLVGSIQLKGKETPVMVRQVLSKRPPSGGTP